MVGAVVLLYLAFAAVRLWVFAGDPHRFITYDGLAYYRLARDPMTSALTEHGITFTRPAYWQTRIGYPATVWALTLGGRAGLVPGALIVVNLAAVGVMALLGARLSRQIGVHPWWGAVPALWAGYVVGVGQDLTEPLAGALLLGALLALRLGRDALAALLLTGAGLTRETTLVVALAVLMVAVLMIAVLPRLRSRPAGASPAWWVGAIPLAIYAGWRLWVRSRWAEVAPDGPGDGILRPPGAALFGYARHAFDHPLAEAANLALLLPTLVVFVMVASVVFDRGGTPYVRLALAAYALLLCCLPVWDRGQAYLRWGCEPLLLGWLLLIASSGRRRLIAVALLTALVWCLAATQSLSYPRADGVWGGWWSW